MNGELGGLVEESEWFWVVSCRPRYEAAQMGELDAWGRGRTYENRMGNMEEDELGRGVNETHGTAQHPGP